MSTDHNEAIRLADELDHLDYDDSRRVAAFLREQAVARAMDTFGHNVMAGRAQLQMVRLESRLQSVTAERDQHQATATALIALLADIRKACGDNGKRMQPELVEFIGAMSTERDQLRAEVERLRAVVLRMAAGIDHLSEIARQWEPDHSSGADRRGWVLAKDARNDALKLLKEHAARTTHKETE